MHPDVEHKLNHMREEELKEQGFFVWVNQYPMGGATPWTGYIATPIPHNESAVQTVYMIVHRHASYAACGTCGSPIKLVNKYAGHHGRQISAWYCTYKRCTALRAIAGGEQRVEEHQASS